MNRRCTHCRGYDAFFDYYERVEDDIDPCERLLYLCQRCAYEFEQTHIAELTRHVGTIWTGDRIWVKRS